MLGLQRDFLLAVVYIPPENAKVYELYDDNNGINLLEDVLTMLLHEFKNLLIVLTGDFNARIGDMLDFIVDDSIDYLVIDDFYELDTFTINRKTKYVNLNSFGQTLVNLCKSFIIHVINGRTKGDSLGELIYISKT